MFHNFPLGYFIPKVILLVLAKCLTEMFLNNFLAGGEVCRLLYKQFEPRSGRTKRPSWSWAKPFDTLIVFLKDIFWNSWLWKSQQATKNHEKSPSMQRVKNSNLIKTRSSHSGHSKPRPGFNQIWVYSVGTKLRYMGYFASLLHPPGRKSWLLFSVRDMSGGLRNSCFTKFFCGQFSENGR